MAKKVMHLLNFIAWLTGVIVSLAVGLAMTNPNNFIIPYIPKMVEIIAGWIVVATTVVSVLLVLFKK